MGINGEARGIRSKRQQVWGWAGVANFVLGGMSTGLYVLSTLLSVLPGAEGIAGAPPRWFKLLAPALAGLGFLCLAIEAGRPLRSRFLLRHLRRSWMSWEALFAAVYVSAALLDWLLSIPLVWGVAVAAAVGFMVSQGFIVYRSRGVTGWNNPLIPLLFITSSLALGGGLMLMAGWVLLIQRRRLLVAVLCAVLLSLAVWLLYVYSSRGSRFRKATRSLRSGSSQALIVGMGHVLPPALMLTAALVPFQGALVRALSVMAGLAIVLGQVIAKGRVLRGASYLRELLLVPDVVIIGDHAAR